MLPIQIALSYPLRLDNLSKPFDPFAAECSDLHFEKCNYEVFGCLELAFHAGRIGGSLPVIMNSANEEAVEAFLAGRIAFTSIEDCIRACMDAHEREGVIFDFSVSDVYEMDKWSRSYVKEYYSASANV
jgi:1-deoxy-D-xylulose-5-phosphate reductoisomerase